MQKCCIKCKRFNECNELCKRAREESNDIYEHSRRMEFMENNVNQWINTDQT